MKKAVYSALLEMGLSKAEPLRLAHNAHAVLSVPNLYWFSRNGSHYGINTEYKLLFKMFNNEINP